MTKEQLFEKYSINESHSEWSNIIDNWMSIEVYRIMHNGDLPNKDDINTKWITDFLDKTDDLKFVFDLRRNRKEDDFGSLYLTSKRMVYRHSESILKELNKD